MKCYAIADLHGRFDLLVKAVDAIHQHAKSSDFKIITLGDYIDRGPDSMHVIEYLKQQDDSFICLQGNHEAMMFESAIFTLDPSWWVDNGGGATFKSYGWHEPYHKLSYEIIPKAHLDWIRFLPLFYETEKQLFVHAGIPHWGMNLPPSQTIKGERLREKMQWMLYSKNDSGGWKGKHVVHGHHQFADGPHQWIDIKSGGRTDLDTWAYKTGRLVIGVFDDTQGHALEFIEVNE